MPGSAKTRLQIVEQTWLDAWGKETGPPIVVCVRKGDSPIAVQKCAALQKELGCWCPTGDKAQTLAKAAHEMTHYASGNHRTALVRECEACGRPAKKGRCNGLCERCRAKLNRETRIKGYECPMCKKKASYSAATLCEVCARASFRGRR